MASLDHPFDYGRSVELSRLSHGIVENAATGVSQLLPTGKGVRAGVGLPRYGYLFANVGYRARARLEADVGVDRLRLGSS